MAYVTPVTRADGYVVDAAEWVKNTVDNPIALRTGAIALTSQTAGDVIIATSSTQLARVAAGATGTALTSNGTGVAPSFQNIAGPTEQTTTATGAQNNFSLNAIFTYLRCTGAAPIFSGFTINGVAPTGGCRVIIKCLGTTAKVTDEATSTAAHQIVCESTQGQIVGADGVIELVYDDTLDRWVIHTVTPGTPIAFTPTWVGSGSNPAIGNGTLTGFYSQRGKWVSADITLVIGGTTTFGTGNYTWALPLTAASNRRVKFYGVISDTGTAFWPAFSTHGGGGTTTTVLAISTTQSLTGVAGQTVPMTWADTDVMELHGEYEVA